MENFETVRLLTGTYSILVVDDDPGIVDTLFDILTAMNFKVRTARDGYEAIRSVQAEKFDAILMDLRMPGIDGVETLECIKRMKPDTKVILMTAYASNDRLLAARRAGVSSIVYKPFDIYHLETLLKGSDSK